MEYETSRPGGGRRHPILFTIGLIVRYVLPLAVLVGGYYGVRHLMETGPKAVRRKAPRRARLVETTLAVREDARVVVHAMGTVRPAREVVLRPRVGGEIVTVSKRFVPGARFAEAAPILTIDPTDYELVIRQRESELARVRANLQIEQGNQKIARREYELLGEKVSDEERALLLREPQLETARAAVQSAEAALEDARTDLERTKIHAPFNCLILDRSVQRGAQVATTTELARLVGTDEYWVEVSVPVDELRWIDIPRSAGEEGAGVRIFDEAGWGADRSRPGRVLGLVSALETEGRMARVLVTVTDPLGLAADAAVPAMLLGSYVRVEIDGRTLTGVVAVEHRLIRDGDRIWVAGEDDRLEIREAAIAFRARDRVYLSAGVRDGERIVVSDLSSPVPGMALRFSKEVGDAGGKAER